MRIPENAARMLDKQHFVIVSSVDQKGSVDSAAKGIIEVDPKGRICVLDLYRGRTYRNIKKNPRVTLTAIDERRFRGYSIKGKARIMSDGALPKRKLSVWQDKIAKRIARRLIKHVKEETPDHEDIPEARFPLPKHIIEIDVLDIIDIAPHRAKKKQEA